MLAKGNLFSLKPFVTYCMNITVNTFTFAQKLIKDLGITGKKFEVVGPNFSHFDVVTFCLKTNCY